MTQRFVEGFATYGLGNSFSATSKIGQAMLAGRWASLNGLVLNTIGQLPWAPTDTDYFFSGNLLNAGNQGARVVLPVSAPTMICSLYFAVNMLPAAMPAQIMSFCDGSNTIMAGLAVTTTGAINAFLYNPTSGFVVFASSSGPVLTAQSAAHIEAKLVVNSAFQVTMTVQVNGVTCIASAVYTQTGPTGPFSNIAQMRFIDEYPAGAADLGIVAYIGNLIIRDNAGSVNNDIVGDRRVGTLFVNSDTLAHQGWTAQPLHRFGTGIYDNTADNGYDTAVIAGPAVETDIGPSQFTIEGNFRFQALPTGANKATLFAKWDAPHAHMSYELYVGGPSLEAGNTVFRISTDGTAGTVQEIISWPVQWQPGEWYHVAVTRDATNHTRLFINGVQQGLPQADAHTYFSAGVSGAYNCLGGEHVQGSGITGWTSFNGWNDEFRFTVGVCRYAANFSPPVAAFPRGGLDTYWANVVWISGWDTALLLDESGYTRALSSQNGAAAITPNDGAFNYQTINKQAGPNDNTFIEAALLSASDLLTYVALPTASTVIRVGTKDGSAAANYTWKAALTGAAFEVLIGASIAASISNLTAAINAGAGAGTVYGTGTTVNYDVSANILPSGQLEAVALTPGAVGNAIVATSTDTNGTWATATLAGGQDIPSYSQFGYQRLPSNTTLVDSVTILSRSWKTDAGACIVRASFVGGSGGVANGADVNVTTAPTFYADTFETDPDTSGPLTPTTILLGNVKIDRTV